MGFVHLHVHSQYSLLDGACIMGEKKDKMMALLKELGQDTIAITDHGNMYGAIKFYKSAKANGIKPIIGCEVYTAARTRFDKTREYDSKNGHLILLCKNNEGYQNLIKIVSLSNTEGFYYKPRIDKELLEKYHEGLICLSACLAGDVPRLLVNGHYDEAKELALWYDNLFGRGNYYLEIQDHGIAEQKIVIDGLLKMHEETGIPLVATNDAHYLRKKDAKAQKVLTYVQMKKTLSEESGLGFETEEFYLKSEQEMRDLFSFIPEACDNTVKIAEMCEVTFPNLDDPDHKVYHLPNFVIPGGKDHYEFLRELAYSGYERKYPAKTDELTERLEYELGVVHKMGFVDYFLIVSDYVRFAKRTGIPVGPGRGSGAGSMVAYCIDITNIEPIKYNLLFERFLNPERVSMPDFDVDFCVERRQEVVDYCIQKYGAECVAQIVTFGTMKAKMAVKDVARVLEFSPSEANEIAKLLQDKKSIMESVELMPELREMYNTNPKIKELIDLSASVENAPRHTSVHACGVIIAGSDVSDYVPLAVQDDMPVTQYDMVIDEELGLLKMDFLGLRNLTVIEDACRQIRKKIPDFQIDKVDMDDKAVYDMLSLGQTDGVFQLESGGMKKTLIQLKPKNIEDITAVISLYRPGPMDSIPVYINNSYHPESIKYKHPMLKSILEVTHGCMVYQEQVMQVVRKLAGYSFGRADIVRRAMGKKKMDVMQREREFFIHGKFAEDGTMELPGAVRNGVPEDIANDIFDEMIEFAKYAFNKSHAAAYAFVTYYTAYLKCHFKKEYMSALLTSVLSNPDKMVGYINEAQKQNVPVLAPDINESEVYFSVSGENIRFGLTAVKNVGTEISKNIIKERESKGLFKSFYDFLRRMMKNYDVDSRTVESLIYSGAFDSFGNTRKQLIVGYPELKTRLQSLLKEERGGQLNLFDFLDDEENEDIIDDYKFPEVPEFTKKEKLKFEKEVTGLYLSEHPMKEYAHLVEAYGTQTIGEIFSDDSEYGDGDKVEVMGILAKVTKKMTRNDTMMAILQLQDLTGTLEVLLFGKAYERNQHLLVEDKVVIVKGRLSIEKDDFDSDEESDMREIAKIIGRELSEVDMGYVPPEETLYAEPEVVKTYAMLLSLEKSNAALLESCMDILRSNPGTDSVYFNFTDVSRKAKFQSGVDLSDVVCSQLRDIVGPTNVLVKEVAG